MTDDFDLKTLSAQAGVTPRTVHFYLQQGLLPSPLGGGRGARYAEGHLARLRLIRRLQKQHLPLAEIRRRLEMLSDDDVRDLLAQEPDSGAGSGSALEYVRSVLSGMPAASPMRSATPPGIAALRAPSPDGATPVAERSQWDRIVLADDVELSVRRPLARERNRQVEKLLALAREIFKGDLT